HDHLGEEFLNYQTMPTTSLQDETEMESFWAGMATRKHKVYFFLAFFLAGVAWLHLFLLFIPAYMVSYMMQTMQFVSELCYSILTVLIKTTFCSLFIFKEWQEPKNLRGLLLSPSWSWCCPTRMQMLRGCFQLWD